MSKWRVQFSIATPSAKDAVSVETIGKSASTSTPIFDAPVNYLASTDELGKQVLVLHDRMLTEADARKFYNSIKSFFSDPTIVPMGVLPLGASIEQPTELHGTVSLHLCTHDDAVPVDCKQSQYEETVF